MKPTSSNNDHLRSDDGHTHRHTDTQTPNPLIDSAHPVGRVKRLLRASLLCWAYNASRPGENSSSIEECLLSTCCQPQICRKIYAVEIFCWWWSLPMCASMKYYGNTCCVEFFGESNVIHISYFPFPRWNYSNFWIQCKRNCHGPHWSHPVWILFPWINSDQLNVSTAKKNPQIRNIKNGNNALDSDDLILWKFLI